MPPPKIEERLIPGRWEDDLIIVANNRSAIDTLVKHATRLLTLVKLNGTTATAAAVGFSDKLNEVSRSLRFSITYYQGREMVKHAEITQKTETAIYFADPHSSWQQGSNENTNVCCGSTCRRARTCRSTARERLTPSPSH
nr:IS30 family transposase [Halomonas maris]|tara:strand:- start:2356 stop:2775 length:420 start_codon:yes stop_codon:yes gene_type:complete